MMTIIVIILVLTTIVSLNRKFSSYKERIGASQFQLMNSYEDGEKILHYMDSSLGLGVRESVATSLERNFGDGSCGTYMGYYLLNDGARNCLPDFPGSINRSAEYGMQGYFPRISDKGIPVIDYELRTKVKDDSIIVSAAPKKLLKIEIDEFIADGSCCEITDVWQQTRWYVLTKEPELCLALSGRWKGDIVENRFCLGQSEFPEITQSEDITLPGAVSNYSEPPPAGSGKCQDVADYAKTYADNQCPYSAYYNIYTPQNCRNGGLTCASFVQSVWYYMKGPKNRPSGNGNTQCSNPLYTYRFKDPSQLQPGDVFSANWYIGSTPSSYGHAGMYIGRGKFLADQPAVDWICHRGYTPDNEGVPIFTHSIPNGGVCYSSLTEIFGTDWDGFYELVNFCRHKECA